MLSLAAGLWRLVHPSGELATDLVFGWIGFLRRVLPQIHVHGPGVAVFLASLLGAIGLAHLLFRSFQRKPLQQGSSPARWRLSWTTAIVLVVVVMFAAGISFVGAVHQVVWLMTSDGPLFGYSVQHQAVYSSRATLPILRLALANDAQLSHNSSLSDPGKMSPPQSWIQPLLLSIGYLPEEIDPDQPWNAPVNAPHFRKLVPMLLNSRLRNAPLRDSSGFGLSHYSGNSQLFDTDLETPTKEVLQRSNLLLIGEVNSNFTPWGKPGNCRDPEKGLNSPNGFGGVPGSKGVLFIMADGALKELSLKTDPEILKALSRP